MKASELVAALENGQMLTSDWGASLVLANGKLLHTLRGGRQGGDLLLRHVLEVPEKWQVVEAEKGNTPEVCREADDAARDEFERAYAADCGLTVEGSRALGLCPAPCDCDEKGCHGWKMVSNEPREGVPVDQTV